MRNDLMNFYEVEVAANNINSIESSLGHPIPSGMVDVSALGDHLLNPIEVEMAAYNIKSVMAAKTRSNNYVPGETKPSLLGYLILFIVYAALAYAGGSILFAFLSVLFN